MNNKDTGTRYPAGTDYRPRRERYPSAEWHLTYRCNLDCYGCNRASFLKEPHTPDMTIADAVEFIRQARDVSWEPAITITGGEPTIHPQFEQFVKLASDTYRHPVRVWSNAFAGRSRNLLETVSKLPRVEIFHETAKPDGGKRDFTGISGWTDDCYVSPSDYGEPLRVPCYAHCSVLCGVSVDNAGYSPCARGGPIDALLDLGVRTKRLADLFDIEKCAELTARLCQHCGHQTGKRENVDACPKLFGVPVSPTWEAALKDRK